MKISVELIKDKWFYETEEWAKKCSLCKTEYERKKTICKECSKKIGRKKPLEPFLKERFGQITADFKWWSCSCVYGSLWRFNKKRVSRKEDPPCKHYKLALRMIVKQLEKEVEGK